MFDFAAHKARELAADYKQYVLNGHASRKCEKEFLWRCQEALGLNIQVLYLPPSVPITAMFGTYIRHSDGHDIVLRSGMQPEWERFVLVKEIFHAILDSEPFRNPNIIEHLDKTLFGETPAAGPLPLHVLSEYATQSAAAEFLFPWSDRKSIIDCGRATDISGIATEFDIPTPIVEYYLGASAMKFYEFP